MEDQLTVINLGGVNCYLLQSESGFLLIDSGFSAKRQLLLKKLNDFGCQPGKLKLVLHTHGDHDHAGNSVFLRDHYGAKLAMHEKDAGIVENGDHGWNRKENPDRFSLFFRLLSLMVFFVKTGEFEKFSPDILVEDGLVLQEYGFDATVVSLPGHSKGSIGVLTGKGELVCGDLIYNFFGIPSCHLIDDRLDFDKSMEKLQELPISTLYPGHGKPFPPDRLFRKST